MGVVCARNFCRDCEQPLRLLRELHRIISWLVPQSVAMDAVKNAGIIRNQTFRVSGDMRGSGFDGAEQSGSRRGRSPDVGVNEVEPTKSTSFMRTLELARLFAKRDRTVILVEGEPGTGKTRLARHIHLNSPRRDQTFHRVDLGTLDDPLTSSDLFGHLSGSFSGAT